MSPPSSPSSAAYSQHGSSSSPQHSAGLARTPTARMYPIATSLSRHGRNARVHTRLGLPFPLSPAVVGIGVCGWSGDAGGLHALTPSSNSIRCTRLLPPP
ncbi:hypothetical protein B0H14DRAFT_3510554 [Mycena olivaceomarginata]|nr:hypothetical protein B0H14DRAFT_3510554 [Mycena olivaceomarginata]